MVTRSTLLLVALLALAGGGCFDKPKPACAFLCGTDNACPAGYSCATDGWCKRDDMPNATCDELPADASVADAAAEADATPADGGPDATNLLADGEDCGSGTECQSGNCSNSKCCDTPCSGSCDVCSVALGASADGTCTLRDNTVTCRAAAGTCDVEEKCTGSSPDCPADDVRPDTFMCGSSTGAGCDVDDYCDGSTKDCPDLVRSQGDLGTPDCVEYVCDGTNPTCPASCASDNDCDQAAGCSCDTVTTFTCGNCA